MTEEDRKINGDNSWLAPMVHADHGIRRRKKKKKFPNYVDVEWWAYQKVQNVFFAIALATCTLPAC